jgi:hypothetical protein
VFTLLTSYFCICCFQAFEGSFVLVNLTDISFGYTTGKWSGGWSRDIEAWNGLACLDTYGRVYADPIKNYWPANAISSPCIPLVETKSEKISAFKYLSGRVVQGNMVARNGERNKFVPKIGEKVMSIYQYLNSYHMHPNHFVPRLRDNADFQPPERMVVYNLPAYTILFKYAVRDSMNYKTRIVPFPVDQLDNSNSTVRKNSSTVKYYMINDNKKCKYISRVGADFYQGTLKNGEFFPDFSEKIPDAKAMDYLIYCKPLIPNEQVYECYDDALVPGFLYKIPKGEVLVYPKRTDLNKTFVRAADDDYVFVPTVGATVISLQQYLDDYIPGKSRRIHNLPGTIEPVSQKK